MKPKTSFHSSTSSVCCYHNYLLSLSLSLPLPIRFSVSPLPVCLCLSTDTFLKPEEGRAGPGEALRHAAGRAQEQSQGEGAPAQVRPPPANPPSQGPSSSPLPPFTRPPPGLPWQRYHRCHQAFAPQQTQTSQSWSSTVSSPCPQPHLALPRFSPLSSQLKPSQHVVVASSCGGHALFSSDASHSDVRRCQNTRLQLKRRKALGFFAICLSCPAEDNWQ